jgi:putative SOS response-associated peptidase YedK
MCGRYTHLYTWAQIRELHQLAIWPPDELPPSYNVPPTADVPVVRQVEAGREGVHMRWGLIPFFARGEPPKYSTINARIESVQTAASYRGPWQRGQRCLQLASGFYEWHVDDQGRKAPYYITVADQPVFAFAGLWDRSIKADGTAVESVVHITLPGNELLRHIHNTGGNPYRMPAILEASDAEVWLTGTANEAWAALRPYRADSMVAWEVSKAVNSPKNNLAAVIEPVRSPQPSVHTPDPEASPELPLEDAGEADG